jgi:ketosteroid isomerase-like protein
MISALLFLLLAATPEDQIRSAETHWAQAVQAGNLAELEKIFTPGLIYAHSTGVIQDRKQFLDQLRSGTRKYSAVKQERIQVSMYGDSAVAHSIMRMVGVNDKGPFDDRVMMMHFWVKQSGQWRLTAHQTTKLPD